MITLIARKVEKKQEIVPDIALQLVNEKLRARIEELESQLREAKKEKPTSGAETCLNGFDYFLGLTGKRDYKKALQLFKSAGESDNNQAWLMVARMYADGKGTAKSLNKSQEIYTLLANKRVSEACYQLSIMAETGVLSGLGEFDNKNDLTVDWLIKAAELKNSSALAKLGKVYELGLLEQMTDIEEAVKFYKEAIEVDGNCEALNSLGSLYYRGEGVKQSYTLAVDMFREAAAEGLADALNNLGLCYEYGKGVERNLEKALKCYEDAIESNNASAMVNKAAILIKTNVGVDKEEYIKAEELLRQSLSMEENKFAYFYLGYIYEHGLNGDKLFNISARYYEKAAELGHVKAKVKIAVILYDGVEGVVPQNRELALQLLGEAAEQDDAEAINYLGLIVEKEDKRKAERMFETSHMRGNDWASLNLAINRAENKEEIDTETYLKSSISRGNLIAKDLFASWISRKLN